jgi:hypothetical protein
MARGHIQDYLGGLGSVGIVRKGFDIFYLVYNDTGGALTDGDVVAVEFLGDADTTNGYNIPTVSTPAASATSAVIGVVNNQMKSATSIADAAWGYIQVRGYCPAITHTTADGIAIDDYLTAKDGVLTASLDGGPYSVSSFAIAKSAKTGGVAGTVTGILLGREVTVVA